MDMVFFQITSSPVMLEEIERLMEIEMMEMKMMELTIEMFFCKIAKNRFSIILNGLK